MKRFPLILMLSLSALAVSCVGQKDDEDDPSPLPPVVTDGEGNALVIDFTATWCVNCPRMTSAIEEAVAERPGEIVPLCVHYADAFACGDGLSLVQRFAVQAYPSAVVDMDGESLTTATSKEIILSRIDERKALKKAACTLEANAVSPAEGSLEASVDVTAQAGGAYRLWVLLVEDGLVAAQTGGSENEVHNHVLRRFLYTGADGYALGTLEEGASTHWDAKFEGLDLTGGCRLVIFVTEEDSSLVNTVLSIPIG